MYTTLADAQLARWLFLSAPSGYGGGAASFRTPASLTCNFTYMFTTLDGGGAAALRAPTPLTCNFT